MTPTKLHDLLSEVARGELAIDTALARLRNLPYEDLGIARVDHHRSLRQGVGEVIFAENKTPGEVQKIVNAMRAQDTRVLCTRADRPTFTAVKTNHPEARYHERARCITITPDTIPNRGHIGVLCAGTSDLAVAEEASITAEFFGARVTRMTDVGVAGIHRLLDDVDLLHEPDALIVIAGMEGALPSVVGGLVAQPVIAVPTSVGYGTNLGGLTTLLAMLSSCAAGVSVVNIDNGFGAAMAAIRVVGRNQPSPAR